MDKQNVVYPLMDYHSGCKRKEILTPAITWVGLEDIRLSDTGHRRTNTPSFHSCEAPKEVRFIETGSGGGWVPRAAE